MTTLYRLNQVWDALQNGRELNSWFEATDYEIEQGKFDFQQHTTQRLGAIMGKFLGEKFAADRSKYISEYMVSMRDGLYSGTRTKAAIVVMSCAEYADLQRRVEDAIAVCQSVQCP